ncbi:hypothetical protein CCH79_00007343 [Gambusia affinis]|uniref:E3 ubiquitin-protein ligase MARCHF2 n=1 Tax=Gambusia affinis TaxID=33528 RepID=A0A315VDF8_GAMAF|nr:hypothetical protein CCH79_00007343 [Gambusia affinis]
MATSGFLHIREELCLNERCPVCLSDGPICRICHEGGSSEGLLSPCDCTGTLGTVHKSCLEKWLSSSNTSYCELCHTEFSIERRPKPLKEWLQDPGPRNEKRTLFCDMVCFLFITPLAAISGWLCLRGAQDHLRMGSWLQAVGLIALTIALFTIYVLWTLVSFRYHCQLYSEWRRTNQKVRLLIPEARESSSSQHSLLSNKLKKSASESIRPGTPKKDEQIAQEEPLKKQPVASPVKQAKGHISEECRPQAAASFPPGRDLHSDSMIDSAG